MSAARARVLEFEVSVDRERVSRSALGGAPIPLTAEPHYRWTVNGEEIE